MVKKEVVAILEILSQKLWKSDGLGYNKYMGDGFWKTKIKAGMNIEEEVDTLFHEFGEFLFELYRGFTRSDNCKNLDHFVCVKIAKKASDILMKRLKEGEIKGRKKNDRNLE